MNTGLVMRASAAFLGVLGACATFLPEADAFTIVRSEAAFMAVTTPGAIASFDDVAPGTLAPLSSGQVSFPSTAVSVANSLVSQPHSFWFGSKGSNPNFAIVTGGPVQLQAMFPFDVVATGFPISCFACDIAPNDTLLSWSTHAHDGRVIESGATVVDLSSSGAQFFGLVTERPFRSVHVARQSISQPGLVGTWLIDDVRYAAARDQIAEVPTLHIGALVILATFLVVAVRRFLPKALHKAM